MDKINDGGAAFPVPEPGLETGMTLRDYFAAQVQIDAELGVQYAEALIGRKMPDYASDTVNNAIFWADVHARLRFISADAMLRAREC